MKSLKIVFAALMGILFVGTLQAQNTSDLTKKTTISTAVALQTEAFQTLGNCGMCEKKIETAALAAGAKIAEWDAEKDLLTVTFESEKTSKDAIQKAVALAGYDNAGYKAPDKAYKKLHGCCQYDRSGAPGTAKSCGPEKGN